MACLIAMDGPLKGQRVELDRLITRVGRREGNDWVLPDGSVSGTHCEFEKTDSGFLVRDLGSTNGTKVNNEPIKEHPLFRNDVILVGEIPVMIDGDDIPANASGDSSSDPCSIPRTTIVIQQNRNLEAPKEFSKKSSANKIWIAVIAVLILVILGLLVTFMKGWFSAA